MASTFWIAIAVIAVVSIICSSVVKIIVAAKSSGGGKFSDRVDDLEDETQDLKSLLENARQRIEVLEKIVTDQKYDLGREIDDLDRSTG